MKNFKRLSILLLSVVMVFSCFAVLSLAQEDEEAKKIAAVESLLEYFDDDGIYICDPFDGEENDLALEMDSNSEGVYADVDGKKVWTATLNGKNVLCSKDDAIRFADDYQYIAVVYSFRVDADENNEDKGYVALEFSGDSTSAANTDGQSIFVFDYNEEKAYIATMDKDVIVSSYEIEGFVPENGVWYTLSLVYNKKANTFDGEIAAEGVEAKQFSCKLNGNNALYDMVLRSRNRGNENVTISWDSLEVYEGSFIRSNAPGARQAYLDKVVYDYMLEYQQAATSEAMKTAIISTLDSLFALGYAPTPGSDAAILLDEEFNLQMLRFYWDQFAEGVAAFDKTQKYKARYEALIAAKPLEDDYPVRPGGIDPSIYESVIAKYEAERDALARIAEYSEALLEAVRQNTDSMDYQQLLAWIIDFDAKKEKLIRNDGSYDDTYTGVQLAMSLYQDVADRLYKLKVLSLDYINAVDAMNRNYATDFGVKYNAYLRASAIFNDPQFVYISESYDAAFSFIDDETVSYDGREFRVISRAEDGKSAVVSINALPYTVSVSNYQLTLVGEGLTIVFKPADDSTGTKLAGNWKSAKTIAEAMADFDNRDDFIVAGEKACKDFMSAIDAALVSKGYAGRTEKRDAVKNAYDSKRAIFEEGGDYYGFAGLAARIAAFDAFCAQIDADVVNADAYINLVITLKNLDPSTNYNDIKSIVDDATLYYELLTSDMADYVNAVASIREADQLYTVNKRTVLVAEDSAVKFTAEVEKAAAAVGLAERLGYLRAAQKLSAALYDGMEGMDVVIAAFEAEKAEYLADASAMNSVAAQECTKLVQIAFANLKNVTTTKVAFIIKKIYEL